MIFSKFDTQKKVNEVKNKKISVDLLLSTYNPKLNFLSQFIDSLTLQEQLDNNVELSLNLLWRDDGSDNLDSIEQYLKTDLWTIKYRSIHNENIGFLQSYNILLDQSKSDFAFICDQDDVWHSDKLKSFLAEAQDDDQSVPKLYFSDLRCIDDSNTIMKPSLMTHYGYRPTRNKAQFFLKNYIPGCSMMINQPLKSLYTRTNNYIFLHDHVLALLSICYGDMKQVSGAKMDYRLHANNTLGFLKSPWKAQVYTYYLLVRFWFRPTDLAHKLFPGHFKQLYHILEGLDCKWESKMNNEYRLFKDFFIHEKIDSTHDVKFCFGIGVVQSILYTKMHKRIW